MVDGPRAEGPPTPAAALEELGVELVEGVGAEGPQLRGPGARKGSRLQPQLVAPDRRRREPRSGGLELARSEVAERAVRDVVCAGARLDDELSQHLLGVALGTSNGPGDVALRPSRSAAEVHLRPPGVVPPCLKVTPHRTSVEPAGFPLDSQ